MLDRFRTLSWVVLFVAALGLHVFGAQRAHAEEPNVQGDVPANGGIALVLWSGGSVSDVPLATLPLGCAPTSVRVVVDGALVGYRSGGPDFVNAAFMSHYTGGALPEGVILLLLCDAITPMPGFGLPDSAFQIEGGVCPQRSSTFSKGSPRWDDTWPT